MAQALKNFDGGASYAGVHAVNNARGEECNTHDFSVLSSVFRVSRSHRLRLGQAEHCCAQQGRWWDALTVRTDGARPKWRWDAVGSETVVMSYLVLAI